MEDGELILRYKRYCFKEFIRCVEHLTLDEQIHFADSILVVLPSIFLDEKDNSVEKYIEEEIYKKYRNRVSYFCVSGYLFHFYFEGQDVFNKFCGDENIKAKKFSREVYEQFWIEMYDLFERIKKQLYISDPNSKGFGKNNSENELIIGTPSPSHHKEKQHYSRKQQVLLMYYLLEAMEKKIRIEVQVSDAARFLHAMLGWEYTDINNTRLYQLLKQAPDFKTPPAELYKDLVWVRKQFEIINLIPAIELVDEKMKALESKLNAKRF